MLIGTKLLDLYAKLEKFNIDMSKVHNGDIDEMTARCKAIDYNVKDMMSVANSLLDETLALKSELPKARLVEIRKVIKKVYAIQKLNNEHHYGVQFLERLERDTAINDFIIDMEIAFRERLSELGKTDVLP